MANPLGSKPPAARLSFKPSLRLGSGQARSAALDVTFAFDTTGSMYQYLDQVRNELKAFATALHEAVPDVRIGVIAYGDYCDRDSTYVTKQLSLTPDIQAVRNFLLNVESTGGGDEPEAVEEALSCAREAGWRLGSRRALVIVGDAPPHGVIDPLVGKDYREEAKALASVGIVGYPVLCGQSRSAREAFAEVASLMRGRLLQIGNVHELIDILLAVCLKEMNQLTAYVEKMRLAGRLTTDRKRIFAQLTDGKGS